MMEKRILGRIQLPVTMLGFGAMELRYLNEADAGVLLNSVLDQGINYGDTSPDYGPSEEFFGNALSNPAHLAENIRAAEAGPLPVDTYHKAVRRLTAAGIAPAEI